MPQFIGVKTMEQLTNRISIGVLWSVIVAMYPIALWVDARYAHAEDVSRSNAQIILEAQQSDINFRKDINSMRIERFTDMLQEGRDLRPDQEQRFQELQDERHRIIMQETDIDRLRREIR